MLLYLLYMRGAGEGCDFTIACNETCVSFKAKDWEAAEEIAAEHIHSHEGGECYVEKATLYQVGEAKSLQPRVLAKRHSRKMLDKERLHDLKQLKALAQKLNIELPEVDQ